MTRDEICAWREGAVADGWTLSKYYDSEPIEHSFNLDREGFHVAALIRPASKIMGPQNSISIWGPDGLAIEPAKTYSWDQITAGLEHCNYCGSDGVKTERVGFAGRCCEKCLPGQRKISEYDGWTR